VVDFNLVANEEGEFVEVQKARVKKATFAGSQLDENCWSLGAKESLELIRRGQARRGLRGD